MPTSGLHYKKKDVAKAIAVTAFVFVVVAAVGLAAYGLVSGGPDAHSAAVRTAPPSTVAPTVPATTVAPSTTTTTVPAMKPTTHPLHVPGGTFVVVGGEVKLKHVVAKGENLTEIAAWFDMTMGYQAMYALNKSIIGKNPDLIFPGETLTVEVPTSVIPHIAPVWLADASAGQ